LFVVLTNTVIKVDVHFKAREQNRTQFNVLKFDFRTGGTIYVSTLNYKRLDCESIM